jgi:PadR family transcriptional regulator PadR
MPDPVKLSYVASLILGIIDNGAPYGFRIMEETGLPSGTVYPALRRLERDALIRSRWEKQSIADDEQRPARKYYSVTPAGRLTLEAARKRYPLLANVGGAPAKAKS